MTRTRGEPPSTVQLMKEYGSDTVDGAVNGAIWCHFGNKHITPLIKERIKREIAVAREHFAKFELGDAFLHAADDKWPEIEHAVTQFANVLINNERRALRFLNAEEEFQPRERRERECEAPADPAPAAKKARTEPAK